MDVATDPDHAHCVDSVPGGIAAHYAALAQPGRDLDQAAVDEASPCPALLPHREPRGTGSAFTRRASASNSTRTSSGTSSDPTATSAMCGSVGFNLTSSAQHA